MSFLPWTFEASKGGQDEWELSIADITVDQGQVLGNGGFTNVYLGTFQGVAVAVKRFEVPGRLEGEETEVFDAEVATLRAIGAAGGHENVLGWYGAVRQPGRNNLIVLEYCSRGTLKEQLVCFGAGMQVKSTLELYVQVASAIAFLHEHRIMWRDCKCSNILLQSPSHVKIADFGLSKLKCHNETMTVPERSVSQVSMSHVCGTRLWMAPELHSAATYDESIDVFAFGVSMLECLVRPLNSQAPRRAVMLDDQLIHILQIPLNAPQPLADLIADCMNAVAMLRPTALSALKRLKQMVSSTKPSEYLIKEPIWK